MEPERQIEKLLRGIAKKRRDQAGEPLQLHPVARQELLREVSLRTRQKDSRGFFSDVFSAFRPRLVLGACTLVLLAIGGWLVLPLLTGQHRTQTLAAVHDLDFVKKSAPATAAAPAAEMPQANPNSAPALQPSPANETAGNRDLVLNALAESNGTTVVSVESGAVPPTQNATLAQQEEKEHLNISASAALVGNRAPAPLTPISQRFFRVIAAAPATRERGFGGGGGFGGVVAVLGSFQVEQNGARIRVMDADGSVYTGSWQTAPFDKAPDTAAAKQSTKAEPQTPLAPNYFFRVTGTNHNLNQNIVFFGSFVPLTNVLTAHIGGVARMASDARSSSPLLNSRITGQVKIGNGDEIELNATPAQ
jgi:hypothetical protein